METTDNSEVGSPDAKTLGTFLRQLRQSRGISLEQVASATKVSIRVLQSLESDQYSELPAKPFVRGFVHSYAKFLGQDPKEIFAKYSNFIDEKAKDRVDRESGHTGYAFEKRDTEKSRTFLWITMGVFVLFGGIGLLILKPALKRRQVSHLEQLRSTTAPKPSDSTQVEAPATVPSTLQVASLSQVGTASVNAEVAVPEKVAPAKAEATKVEADLAEAAKIEAAKAEAKKLAQEKLSKESKEKEETAKLNAEKERLAQEKAAQEKAAQEKAQAVSVAGVVEPGRKPAPEDPMNKGDTLTAQQIKQKVVIKALTDVWIRFQVDGKPSMRIVLQTEKLLVFRAEKSIHIQVSNSKSTQIKYQNSGFQAYDSWKTFTLKDNNGFLDFPLEGEGYESSTLSKLDPLPTTADPALR